MSQIDKVNFFLHLWWFLIILALVYYFIYSYLAPAIIKEDAIQYRFLIRFISKLDEFFTFFYLVCRKLSFTWLKYFSERFWFVLFSQNIVLKLIFLKLLENHDKVSWIVVDYLLSNFWNAIFSSVEIFEIEIIIGKQMTILDLVKFGTPSLFGFIFFKDDE